MSVTWLTFQADNDWLNEEAFENICDMFVTWQTFQANNDWLNEEAPENIYDMSVTFSTFHCDIFSLKLVSSRNNLSVVEDSGALICSDNCPHKCPHSNSKGILPNSLSSTSHSHVLRFHQEAKL